MSISPQQRGQSASAPLIRALAIIGLAVPVALLAGLIYGALIDDVAKGIGVAGAAVMGIAAVIAVLGALRTDR